MALSAAQRRALPAGAFVYRSRRAYPINTLKRARAALAYAARRNTSGSYATVARAVRRRYGSKIKSVGTKAGRRASTRARYGGRRRR